MGGEISPVKAPVSSQWQFCAPSITGDPASTSATAASAVKGGQIPTSTPRGRLSPSRTAWARSRASAGRPACIFQLPMTSGVRIRPRPPARVGEGGHAGQDAALEELEEGAARRRDVADAAGHAGGAARRRSVSPPPITENPPLSATARPTPMVPAANGAFSKTPMGPFQMMVPAPLRAAANCATVPCPMSSPMRSRGISRTDTVRTPAVASGLGRDHHVHRQPHRDAAGARPVEHAAGRLDAVPLEKRAAHVVAEGGEEREGHAAAHEEPVHLLQQVLDEGELVGHLGAAQHREQRRAAGARRSGTAPPARRA